jgi:two-component system, cell cycle sensor histidine kinase and response regulator CckA
MAGPDANPRAAASHAEEPTTPAEHVVERDDGHGYLDEVDRLVSLGFLAGGIAHEINNALTSMRLSLGRLTSFELSRRPMSDESRHRVELLQDVREGVSRIERIVRELKSFSHVESGPVCAIDVKDELGKATALVAHEIRHRARLVCEHSPVPPVRARAASLRQVFLNLLLNAIQAIPQGEAHIHEIRITTRTDEQGRVVVEIADTGRGMPTEVAGRLFEPFFTTSPSHALGLGLAISRDVIAALGGEISIHSVEGEGTTVRVVMPASQEVTARGSEMSIDPPVAPTTARRRILIIDDDRPVAAAIAFELHAHDVVVAESGREALEILRREKNYDVILCDLMMPEITGMDVYESIRMTAPSLLERVVMMTGGAFTTQARRFIEELHAPLIEKPFETGQLLKLVEGMLRHEPVEPSGS